MCTIRRHELEFREQHLPVIAIVTSPRDKNDINFVRVASQTLSDVTSACHVWQSWSMTSRKYCSIRNSVNTVLCCNLSLSRPFAFVDNVSVLLAQKTSQNMRQLWPCDTIFTGRIINERVSHVWKWKFSTTIFKNLNSPKVKWRIYTKFGIYNIGNRCPLAAAKYYFNQMSSTEIIEVWLWGLLLSGHSEHNIWHRLCNKNVA